MEYLVKCIYLNIFRAHFCVFAYLIKNIHFEKKIHININKNFTGIIELKNIQGTNYMLFYLLCILFCLFNKKWTPFFCYFFSMEHFI